MQLILISLVSIIIGAVVGYLFHKSKSQQLIIDKEVLTSKLQQLQAEQGKWQEFQDKQLANNKDILIAASREVSKELLDSHKLESKETKEQAEKTTKKETEELHKEFKNVVEKLAALQGQTQAQDKKVSAIWQSLTSPVKASNFAEIGLENTLKNFGLEPGIDFNMQASLMHEGSRLRPDAIINLPAGNMIIIDAKTSKYFIELAAQETDEQILKQKLKVSMNTHLQGLTVRDYTAAGRSKAEGTYVVNVMYLNNESYYGKILECDSSFDSKCREAGVLLVTPASMNMLLNIATHQIAREKQERNYTEIKRQMGKVVSSVDMLLRGLHKVGKSIRDAADNYAALSAPGNRLIGRIKQVEQMGLEPENQLKLPQSLPNFNISENEAVLIEAESDQRELKIIEKKAG